ncbi:MAG: hypothetical protein IKW35_07765 [Paludibacteraceae bacterium]|nr:hypothetical protein [Paludibacteraceae bacterium]
MDNTTLYTVNDKPFFEYPDTFRTIDISADTVDIIQYKARYSSECEYSMVLRSAPKFVMGTDHDTENKNGYYVYYKHTIKLEDLRKSSEFQDGSIYVLYCGKDGEYRGCYNLLASTAYSRTTGRDHRFGMMTGFPIAFVYVQSVNDTFLDMKWLFIQDKHCPSKTNLDLNAIKIENAFSKDRMLDLFGFVEFKLEQVADTAEYFVVEATAVESDGTISDKELSMYLQSNSGYLPKMKLTFTGKTQFKVYKFGLDKGDTIEVKSGYRFWQNTSKVILTV